MWCICGPLWCVFSPCLWPNVMYMRPIRWGPLGCIWGTSSGAHCDVCYAHHYVYYAIEWGPWCCIFDRCRGQLSMPDYWNRLWVWNCIVSWYMLIRIICMFVMRCGWSLHISLSMLIWDSLIGGGYLTWSHDVRRIDAWLDCVTHASCIMCYMP